MIYKTKYLACNMNRIANDHSFARIERVMEAALLKIETAAKEGRFECWIYEQDIGKEDPTCRVGDLAEELRKLGYDIYVNRDRNDIELRVSWGNHFARYNYSPQADICRGGDQNDG